MNRFETRIALLRKQGRILRSLKFKQPRNGKKLSILRLAAAQKDCSSIGAASRDSLFAVEIAKCERCATVLCSFILHSVDREGASAATAAASETVVCSISRG